MAEDVPAKTADRSTKNCASAGQLLETQEQSPSNCQRGL